MILTLTAGLSIPVTDPCNELQRDLAVRSAMLTSVQHLIVERLHGITNTLKLPISALGCIYATVLTYALLAKSLRMPINFCIDHHQRANGLERVRL